MNSRKTYVNKLTYINMSLSEQDNMSENSLLFEAHTQLFACIRALIMIEVKLNN